MEEVSADEKGHLIQAVARYCGTWPPRSNTTAGKIRTIVKVLEEIQDNTSGKEHGTSLDLRRALH